jgi:hypothetical protein
MSDNNSANVGESDHEHGNIDNAPPLSLPPSDDMYDT